jgi:hypothetical protein
MGLVNRRVRHLPIMLAASGALLVLAAVVGWVVQGSDGAIGAASGVAIVAGSFTLSTLVIAWADSIDPKLVLPVGLLTYIVKVLVLGIVLFGMVSGDWGGRTALGLSVMAGVLMWTSLQAWWTWHSKILYVDVDS